MICYSCDYSGDDFTRRGFENGKQVYVCPECGFRSIRHTVDTLGGIESIGETTDAAIEESIKVRKYQDIANFEKRKANEVVRKLHEVESVQKEILEVVSKYQFDNSIITTRFKRGTNSNHERGIIQISDAHFNEIISLAHNKYDFSVASKRLQKLSQDAQSYFDARDITSITVIFSGDQINSDRRTDEMMAAGTNRSVATVIAADIIGKFLAELASKYYVSIHYVVGNESRVGDELAFSNTSAYDNYDYILMQMLRSRFGKNDNIIFIEPVDPNETIVDIGGYRILALHGFNIKQNSMDTNIQQLIGKYASQGILVDYVMCGHYHSPRISSNYARCASLCGANAYSDMYLGLSSRASQNIYVLDTTCKSISGMVVDLQNTDGYSGYKFDELIAKYNPKSAD